MATYLGYHFKDVGIRRRGLSIPLATGSYVHSILEQVLSRKVTGGVVDDAMIQTTIEAEMAEYDTEVVDRGFSELTDMTVVDQIRMEQTWLVGGLCWTWCKEMLPYLLDNFELVAVEKEYERVLGCDCGLSGIGVVEDHKARDCNGVVLMTRPDIIARDLESGALSYHEFKTGGNVAGNYWGNEFEDNIQFALCTASASEALGEPINLFYVHGMHKGSRKDDSMGVRRQQSPFCYAYVKHAIPPMTEMEVRPYYNWVDEDGKNRRAGKYHIKTPVWEIPGISSITDYISMLSKEDLEKNVKMVGPFTGNQVLIDQVLAEMYHEEVDWHAKVDDVRRVVGEAGGEELAPPVLEMLTALIPRSWSCRPFSSPCEFKPICFRYEGWERPLEMMSSLGQDLFELREPNHPIEKMNGLWD
jgi:hypothetical protein